MALGGFEVVVVVVVCFSRSLFRCSLVGPGLLPTAVTADFGADNSRSLALLYTAGI